MPDTFVKGSFNGTNVVLKRNTDILATMHTNDFHTAHLLTNIVLLSEDITFSDFAHQYSLLPFTFIIFYFQFLINVGLSLHKEQDVGEWMPFLDYYFFLAELDKFGKRWYDAHHELVFFLHI